MGVTHFSGPVVVGQSSTSQGYGIQTQSTKVDLTVEGGRTIANVPANSQIIDIKLDVVAVSSNASATMTIGDTSNASLFISETNAAAVARTSLNAPGIQSAFNIGSSLYPVTATVVGANTASTNEYAVVSVVYADGNNVT